MKTLHSISRLAIVISALALLSAYYLPLWQILMWAPQYPEGLNMKIWIDNISGDVKIISALNHYIGMRHIEVNMFPEFGYMIYIVAVVIAVGLITAAVNRRWMLLLYSLLIVACGLGALIDFYLWGYDYGHNLDPTAPIVVPGMSYQPPLIGTKQLLNFTAFSGPDIGGWIFIGAGMLAVVATAFEMYRTRSKKVRIASAVLAIMFPVFTIFSCGAKPEPMAYGKDACYHCKMTIVDEKFGGEVVSAKGKIFKFDDANCLAYFLNSGQLKDQDVSHCLITDFSSPRQFIDARTALFVTSEQIKTPMASNIAAFKSIEDLESSNSTWHGERLSWNELLTRFK